MKYSNYSVLKKNCTDITFSSINYFFCCASKFLKKGGGEAKGKSFSVSDPISNNLGAVLLKIANNQICFVARVFILLCIKRNGIVVIPRACCVQEETSHTAEISVSMCYAQDQ